MVSVLISASVEIFFVSRARFFLGGQTNCFEEKIMLVKKNSLLKKFKFWHRKRKIVGVIVAAVGEVFAIVVAAVGAIVRLVGADVNTVSAVVSAVGSFGAIIAAVVSAVGAVVSAIIGNINGSAAAIVDGGGGAVARAAAFGKED